jgi:hypothetical protein
VLNKLALGAMGGFEMAITAGLAKAKTMVRDAMLNPELATALPKRAPIKPGLGSEAVLTKMLAEFDVHSHDGGAREQQTAATCTGVCDGRAHSTDAEHPFHGIVSSHSTRS